MNLNKKKILLGILGSTLGIGTIATVGAVANYYSKSWTQISFYAKDSKGNNIFLFQRKYRAGITLEEIKNSQVIENNNTINNLMKENQIIDFDNILNDKKETIKSNHSFVNKENIYINFKTILNETRNLELIFDLKEYDNLNQDLKNKIKDNIKNIIYSNINKVLWDFDQNTIKIDELGPSQPNKIKLSINNINVFNSLKNSFLVVENNEYKVNVEDFIVFLNIPKQIQLTNGVSYFAYNEINSNIFSNKLSYEWKKDKPLTINYIAEPNLKIFFENKQIMNNAISNYADLNVLLTDYGNYKFNEYFENQNQDTAKQLLYYRKGNNYLEIKKNDAEFESYFNKNKNSNVELFAFNCAKEYKITINNSDYLIKCTNEGKWEKEKNNSWIELDNAFLDLLKNKTFKDIDNNIIVFSDNKESILNTIETINKKELKINKVENLKLDEIQLINWNNIVSHNTKSLIKDNLLTIENINTIADTGTMEVDLIEKIFGKNLNQLTDTFRKYNFEIKDKKLIISTQEFFNYKDDNSNNIFELEKLNQSDNFLHLYSRFKNNLYDKGKNSYSIFEFTLENKIYNLTSKTEETWNTIKLPKGKEFFYIDWDSISKEKYNKMNNVDDIDKMIWDNFSDDIKKVFSSDFNLFKLKITKKDNFTNESANTYIFNIQPNSYSLEKNFWKINNVQIKGNINFDLTTKKITISNSDEIINQLKGIYNNKYILDRTEGKKDDIVNLLINKISSDTSKWNSYKEIKSYLDNLEIINLSNEELEKILNPKKWKTIKILLSDNTEISIDDSKKNIGEFITFASNEIYNKYSNLYFVDNQQKFSNLLEINEYSRNLAEKLNDATPNIDNQILVEYNLQSDNYFSRKEINHINLKVNIDNTFITWDDLFRKDTNNKWIENNSSYNPHILTDLFGIVYDENTKYFIAEKNDFKDYPSFKAIYFDKDKSNLKDDCFEHFYHINHILDALNNNHNLLIWIPHNHQLYTDKFAFEYDKNSKTLSIVYNKETKKSDVNKVIKEINEHNLSVIYKEEYYQDIKNLIVECFDNKITEEKGYRTLKIEDPQDSNKYIYYVESIDGLNDNTSKINFLHSYKNDGGKTDDILQKYIKTDPDIPDLITMTKFSIKKFISSFITDKIIYLTKINENKFEFDFKIFVTENKSTIKDYFDTHGKITKGTRMAYKNRYSWSASVYLREFWCKGKTINQRLKYFDDVFRFWDGDTKYNTVEDYLRNVRDNIPLIYVLFIVINEFYKSTNTQSNNKIIELFKTNFLSWSWIDAHKKQLSNEFHEAADVYNKGKEESEKMHKYTVGYDDITSYKNIKDLEKE